MDFNFVMTTNDDSSILGILGGVGPLASSKFVESIYFLQSKKIAREQTLPKVLLYSDPSMPDRTEYFSKRLDDILLRHLIQGLTKLLSFGSNKLVICCFTLHHLLPYLPKEILKHIISLPHLALEKVIKLKKKSLLLCTNATSKLKIFESEANWPDASDYIVFPEDVDQEKIHESIYKLKKNSNYEETVMLIEDLLEKYQVSSWIVGCTEFHLLSNQLLIKENLKVQYTIIDPLLMVAEMTMGSIKPHLFQRIVTIE